MSLDFIKNVVDVQISNVSGNTNVSDLETILVMAVHDIFTAPELFRVYTQSSQLTQDGFSTQSYVYRTVNNAFSQTTRPSKIVVSAGLPVVDPDYLTMFDRMLAIQEGWFWLVSDLRDTETQVELATIVEASDKYYVAATHEAVAFDAVSVADLGSRLKELQFNHTYVWFDDAIANPVPESPDLPNHTEIALPARCTSGPIGTVQFLLKRLIGVTTPDSIDTETKQRILTNKGYTYAAYGNKIIYSYGSGKMASGEWIDAQLGIAWITVNIRERVFNTLTSVDTLGYENDGAAVIESDVRSVLIRARDIGIIANDTPIIVTVPDVTELDVATRVSRTLPNVRFRARLRGAIVSTIIRGEVWE